jgi:hypothetical protein
MQSHHRRSGEKQRRGLGSCGRASRRGSVRKGHIEVPLPGREPMRCGFGAVRVGALLGRVRLHLQTDRFLAVHRGDAVWGAGCLQAALALAEIVSQMREGEMDAALPTSFGAVNSRGLGTLRRTTTPEVWGREGGSEEARALGTQQHQGASRDGGAALAAAGNRGAR